MIFEKDDLTEEKLKAHANRGIYIIPEKMSAEYIGKFGFSPEVVIDVGVSRGTPFLYQLFSKSKLLLIDPLPDFELGIRKDFGSNYDFEFFNCGAASKPGTASLKIQSDSVSKSTFGDPTRIQGQKTERIIDVPLRTIDDIASSYHGKVGLKIDTEGHELEVLRGATETLKRAEFVLAEVSIKDRYIAGYRFSDVVAFMKDHGFEIIDMMNPVWRVHMFWDCLFIKKDNPLFSSRVV